jgi:hypothetical protein
MSRRAVLVATPAHAPGQVELLVATRDGSALLTPGEVRALVAELLVAADKADGLEPLSLDDALSGGG